MTEGLSEFVRGSEVATTLRSAYLAGPMRGHEEFNFPAFHRETAWLRERGWTIFSPAERDEQEDGFDPKNDAAKSLDYYMEHDLAAVCSHDAVICLPGWETSQGARLEAVVAVEVGHPVFEIVERYDRAGDLKTLACIDPGYIRFVFNHGGVPDFEAEDTTYADLLQMAEELGIDLTPWEPDKEPVPERKLWEEDEALEAQEGAMRVFESGATRNVDATKPDYEGFISPLVERRFGEFMNANRVQADGSVRDSDNWQKGIPLDSYAKSQRRHALDVWLHHRGFGHLAEEDLETALCALRFNVDGYLHELLKAKSSQRFVGPDEAMLPRELLG